MALSAIVGAAAAGLAWQFKAPPPLQVARLSFPIPEGQSLSSGARRVVAISPDGRQMVYAAYPGGLYLRSLSASEPKLIRGSEGDTTIGEPAFSPDGQWIVFTGFVDKRLKKIPIGGGAAVPICPVGSANGVNWESDGILFVEPGKGIIHVDAKRWATQASGVVSRLETALLQSRPRPVRVRQRHDAAGVLVWEAGATAASISRSWPIPSQTVRHHPGRQVRVCYLG